MGTVSQGDTASFLQGRRFVFSRERLQADQYADSFHSTDLSCCFGPSFCMRPDRRDLTKQRVGPSFDCRDLFFRDVICVGTKPAWFTLAMNRDLLPTIVKDANESCVPANPQPASDILRRR